MADKMMVDKVFNDEPITCDEIRQLLPKYVRNELPWDVTACVRGHLNACMECAVVLGEEIDKAIDVGDLETAPVPPPPSIPLVVIVPSQKAYKSGKVGILWEAAKAAGDALVESAQQLVNSITESIVKFIAGAKPAGLKPAYAQTFRTMGMRLPPLSAEESNDVRQGALVSQVPVYDIECVDEAWESLDRKVRLAMTQKPVITNDGTLLCQFIVPPGSPDETACEGAKLVLTIEFSEGAKVSFESIITNGVASFEVGGLPKHNKGEAVEVDVNACDVVCILPE